MKTKTIKVVLRKKFDDFLKSIDDPKVKELVKRNSIITGGSIVSMYLREPVNDYDIYFTNVETVLAVSHYYTEKFAKEHTGHKFTILDGVNCDLKDVNFDERITPGRVKIRIQSNGIAAEEGFELGEQPEWVENSNFASERDLPIQPTVEIVPPVNPKAKPRINPLAERYRPVYISPNAITLSEDIQLIIRFFGDASEIHSNYDFVHCTCYWTSENGKLVLPSEALECILTKELRYSGSKYPLASIIRTRKFINRGFTINAGQYLKMCLQLNDMDLRDLNVLEDQLTGVDALYFSRMLACMDDEKLKGDLDNTYVMKLIDKFF